MKKLIFSLILAFSFTSAFAQLLLPSGNTVGTHGDPCFDIIMGTNPNVFSCQNGEQRKLLVAIPPINYSAAIGVTARTETIAGTGQSRGIAKSQLSTVTDYFAQGAIVGSYGLADSVDVLNSAFADRTASAIGGSFGARIYDPIVSPTVGRYILAGVTGTLDGNITSYPNDGVVSAGYFNDIIKGSSTWAGYFDGRGYFDDKVGIGAKDFTGIEAAIGDTDYRLFVNGGIVAKKLLINSSLPWADYVFANDYNLLSLKEVETHIATNGHLPNVLSAREIEAQGGFEIGEMTINQQEKIEEIFLHLIEMNKKIEILEAENQALKAQIATQK